MDELEDKTKEEGTDRREVPIEAVIEYYENMHKIALAGTYMFWGLFLFALWLFL